jgi:membrane protease YdiL (CAAX protease family)
MSGVGEIGLIGIIATVILWFGWRQGFFRWQPDPNWNRNLRLYQVVVCFALYFVISNFASFLYVNILRSSASTPESFIQYVTWLNFLISATVLGALFLFWQFLPYTVHQAIWRNPSAKQSYANDLQMSFFAWCLTFPTVLFINQLLEKFLYAVIGIEYIPDQLAVRFVKMTAQYPIYFSLALISVVILAPFIEEFLFRGILQSFIRKHIGSTQAIFITALCFSFFHFSWDQGWGNLPIIGSLFPLALFLGFLYEKQKSLLSSIGLHSLFNLLSILNLYFMGGIPCA